MPEYIEREAVDEAEEEKYWCENCCNFDKSRMGMDGMAYCKLTECLAWCQEYGGNCKGFNVPAADVVEVVRCKDCVYSSYYGKICHYGVGRDTEPNGYCYKGERKDEGE